MAYCEERFSRFARNDGQKNLSKIQCAHLQRCAAKYAPLGWLNYLLQHARVFELDQLIQVEILEAVAARQFDELRRDALYFRADYFVDIGLKSCGLQSFD